VRGKPITSSTLRLGKDEVYVGRGTPVLPPSEWGNPFKVAEHGRATALTKYRQYIVENKRQDLDKLAFETLRCHCRDRQPSLVTSTCWRIYGATNLDR
jgi:hypothetical protein